MACEEKLRQQAVERVLQGDPPGEVARSVHRTVRWLYKWLERRQQASDDMWYKARSCCPKCIARQTPQDTQKHVVEMRKRLEAEPYADKGAQAIQYSLFREGITIPVWTINRILKHHGLIHKRERYTPKGTPYPLIGIPDAPGSLHQIDLWGPRYLRPMGRFYLLNVIDRASAYPGSGLLFSKTDHDVVQMLLSIWGEMGLPDYAQFDNALYFHGSHRHPRSMGVVVRVCLRLGVQPVFIPYGEPWRNGVIEKFNGRVEKKLWGRPQSGNPDDFRAELMYLLDWYRREYRSGTRGGATPVNLHREALQNRPSPECIRDALKEPILLGEGAIHVIRLIRSNLKLDIFGERFSVPARYMYSYLHAVILPDIHKLRVYQDSELALEYDYIVPPTAWVHPAFLQDLSRWQ